MRLRRPVVLLVLALPAAVEIFYLVLPLLGSLRMSFNSFARMTGIEYTFSLDNYHQVISDPYYVRVWVNTVRLAVESAALTVAIGALVAYVLWRVGGRYRAYLTALILAPLLVSGVVRAYGWIAVTGPTGTLANLTGAIGLGRLDLLFHEPAVIIAFVHVFLPFPVLVILAQLDSVQPSVTRAAANLGAGPMRIAGRVLLPIVYPALVSAFLLVFALTMASYAIPAILGGGRVLTIAQVIFLEQNASLNWPRAAALGVGLTLVTVLIMVLYQLILSRIGRRAPLVEA